MGVKIRFWKGAWWIVVHHGGRRKTKRIGDRETAERVARAIREKLAKGDLDLTSTSDTETFRAYATTWLGTMKGTLKASTVAFYEGHLERHVFPALGIRQVASLRRSDCREFVTRCRAKGLKVTTVRGIARTLSTILTQAVEDELLPANPALRLGKYLRTADEPEPEVGPFTRDEAALLVATARVRFPDWYAWVLCGLRTGMRAGELLALQWGDINWRHGFIQVQRNLVRGQLTTPKNHPAPARRPVTAASCRPAALAPAAARGLAKGRAPEAGLGLCVGYWNGARRVECAESVQSDSRRRGA